MRLEGKMIAERHYKRKQLSMERSKNPRSKDRTEVPEREINVR